MIPAIKPTGLDAESLFANKYKNEAITAENIILKGTTHVILFPIIPSSSHAANQYTGLNLVEPIGNTYSIKIIHIKP